MRILALAFTARFIVLTLCVLAAVLLALAIGGSLAPRWNFLLGVALVACAALSAMGVRDLAQTRHAVLRNYPISAHLRFLLEEVRPEIRQYFFESEKDGLPFPRDHRAVVYQRAKMALDKRPFGTQYDVYEARLRMAAAIRLRRSRWPPSRSASASAARIARKPYSASVFNISAMSFGSLSANAIRALNAGAKKGGFAHDTGEGGFSPYHRENGGDIIWEIGSGYFGCRNPDGSFSAEKFARRRRPATRSR